MTASARRLLFWAVPVGLLVIALALAFRPRPLAVDLASVTRGPLAESVTEEGVTRVHDIYTVAAPVAGKVERITLHPGDPVVAGETVVARIEPGDPALLDPRTESQARADLRAAEAAEALTAAEVEAAQAELTFAEREHGRALELSEEGTIAQRDRDDAERALRAARARLGTALAALAVRRFELERARATLMTPTEGALAAGQCACLEVTAPVSGQVLQVLHRSEGTVRAGQPLVEIGDPRDLEVVVDLLTADAVRVEAGQRVLLERWGGEGPLEGRVRRIEPFGFTKVSALGIEEQRVNVLVDLASPPQAWQRLAHGYQLDARIILWASDAVLSVPLLALFRDEESWAVFTVVDGRAALRRVELGRRSDLAAEVVSGLDAGDRVILHPSDRVRPGIRVVDRGA